MANPPFNVDDVDAEKIKNDARNVYRKVTRKIYDFSPEQLANLTSIIWLYRGEQNRFLELIERYLQRTVGEAKQSHGPVTSFRDVLEKLLLQFAPDEETSHALRLFKQDADAFAAMIREAEIGWRACPRDHLGLLAGADLLEQLAEASRDLIKQIDQLYKFAEKLSKENGKNARGNPAKALEALRKDAVEQLKQVRSIFKQAHWLQERFPEARLRDVEGLVKLVDRKEIEANDWSLTPGRYVGVAPEDEDEDFDFEETLRDIHIELKELNEEAAVLADRIQRNFEELGV